MARKRLYDYGAVYRYIVAYKVGRNGAMPSVRQVLSALGMTSPAVLKHAIDVLQAQGLVKRGACWNELECGGERYVPPERYWQRKVAEGQRDD